jgi:ketosteroid isomerase-like protein
MGRSPALGRDTAWAMSDQDQEIPTSLRRIYEAYSRGDFDTAIEMAHPEIELVLPGRQTPLRGVDAVRAWMEPDALEDQRIEPIEFRINGEKALVHQRARARGAGSGVELDIEMWTVWTLDDDGLVTRLEAFLTHEESEALEAAGLSE